MASETRFDDQGLTVVRFGKFEEKDALANSISAQAVRQDGRLAYGREIVDVGEAQSTERIRQLLGDDLRPSFSVDISRSEF